LEKQRLDVQQNMQNQMVDAAGIAKGNVQFI
jgi:hypothetical protein